MSTIEKILSVIGYVIAGAIITLMLLSCRIEEEEEYLDVEYFTKDDSTNVKVGCYYPLLEPMKDE